MPSSDRPISLPHDVLKNSHAKAAKPTDVSVGLKPHILREIAINASSGSRKKPKCRFPASLLQCHAFSLPERLSMTLPISAHINRNMPRSTDAGFCWPRASLQKDDRQLLMPAASSAEWHAFDRRPGKHVPDIEIHSYLSDVLPRDRPADSKLLKTPLRTMASMTIASWKFTCIKPWIGTILDSSAPWPLRVSQARGFTKPPPVAPPDPSPNPFAKPSLGAVRVNPHRNGFPPLLFVRSPWYAEVHTVRAMCPEFQNGAYRACVP